MSGLLQLDETLFFWVNISCQNAFFDWLMPLLRNKLIWVPFYVFIASFLLLNFQRKGLVAVLALLLAVALADNISSQLVKKSVQRLRPCKVMEPQREMYLRVPCGSGYSFPSSHATNHFAIATYLLLLLGKLFKWVKLPLLLWATFIAFAQVYVGVHYPFDVIGGALLGILIGWGMYLLFTKMRMGGSLQPGAA
ncbi:MAG: phosphatase PAP2 family protein [Saprospiraceae bacterium]|nr:phosphatase PAP2 family protein [Saprospiraceae bacterium]